MSQHKCVGFALYQYARNFNECGEIFAMQRSWCEIAFAATHLTTRIGTNAAD
jgi:hypothetical protein